MSDVLEITTLDAMQLQVTPATTAVVVLAQAAPTLVQVVSPGPQGPPGSATSVSTDANNRTTTGSDGGIYTPDITADPLAYYILAKA
jgi:hypothetical protein